MEKRVIAVISDAVGGGEAYSSLSEDHVGPAKLQCVSTRGRVYEFVFPSQEEANSAAVMALRPDIGGYLEVEVVMPDPGDVITHQTATDWLCN